jgi:hypothetical protein
VIAPSHFRGAQSLPIRVINTWRIYSIVDYPLSSLLVFLPPLYNRLSNEQGVGIENLFTSFKLGSEKNNYLSSIFTIGTSVPLYFDDYNSQGMFYDEYIYGVFVLKMVCLYNVLKNWRDYK